MTTALDVLIGNDVKFTGVATNEDGDAVDPSVVTFTVHPETGDDIVYTYGDDVELVRDSLGHFHIWITRDIEGEYTGFFAGSGDINMRGCAKVNMIAECA